MNAEEVDKIFPKLVKLVADLQDADALQCHIQAKVDHIKELRDGVNGKIQDIVYACDDPQELAGVCDSFGFDNKGIRWGWDKAYENTNGRNTNHELQEWHDVLSHTTTELQIYVKKMAKGDQK